VKGNSVSLALGSIIGAAKALNSIFRRGNFAHSLVLLDNSPQTGRVRLFCRPFCGAVCPRQLQRVAIFALIFFTALAAFCSPAGTADYLIDLWTSDNGLPDSSVAAIAQTPEGYLWIGTYNGLARFDGVQFVNFDPFNTPELKHARVDGLFVDAQGTLWINTHDGSMTAWRNGVFTHEWQGGLVAAVFSRSNQIFFALLRGELVCRTGKLDENAEWQSVPLVGTTAGYLFHEDKAGVIWYSTRDGALNRLIGTNAEPVSSKDYLNGERVNCLTADNRGRIWVGTEKRILLWRGGRFEDQTPTNGELVVNTTFIACTANNGFWVVADGKVRKCESRRWVAMAESWQDLTDVDPAFLGAYEDKEGGAWIRHFGKGLFHAKPDGSTQRISSADGLPDDRVSCWFQDREGNIWVGVDRGGLVCLREKKFHVIGRAEGLPIPAVSTVCEDGDGNVWIGTFGGGLNRWRDGALTRFDLPKGVNKGNFFSAYPDTQGHVWLSAGREDLFMLGNGTFSQPSQLVHGIKVILVDHRGQVWMGRQNGLTCLSNDVATNFGPDNGFERKDVRALAEDRQGNIWIGTGDGVLSEFAGGKFTSYRMDDGLENQAIWSLLPDADGTLWVGTFRGGLLRFKGGKFTRYTAQSGLHSDIICQILDDGLGKLWIGSRNGIFYLPKDSLKEFDAGKIRSLPCIAYGLYDGLPTLECTGNYQPSCWRGHDGTLWFATVKGLVSVRPGEVPVNRLPPPVVMEEIFVDGKLLEKEIRPPDKNKTPDSIAPALSADFSSATTLQIPPGKHQFDFHYTALSFAAPDKVRFRYKLEGLDEGWIDADGKRFAHYGPLRPGKYRFQVIACNNDGIWNEAGSAINLKVLPHFWETWWFDVLLTVIIVAAIIGAVRFAVTRNLRIKLDQLKQQRAIERERERIAKDIHDDLGAGLTQILLQSALARREPQEQIQAHLVQISGTALELVGAMDEIVWAINPENDNLDGLVTYVGKYVQEFVTLAGLRCRLDLPAQLPALVLSAEVRHNLFLAVKEALNNAIKHARASEIYFRLKMQPSGFSFVIQDDGRGFVPGAVETPAADSGRVSSGHGLRNLVHRLEKIGGTCTIRSEPGKGTEVELTVMIQSGGHWLRDGDKKFTAQN
jgi:signal transduction histidine kinase/ligand-binding sensor domain-containing protein